MAVRSALSSFVTLSPFPDRHHDSHRSTRIITFGSQAAWPWFCIMEIAFSRPRAPAPGHI